METASRFPGLEGSSILTSGSRGEYFILLRFASHAHLERWQGSQEVNTLIEEADTLSVTLEQAQVKTGFETWFALPGIPAPPIAPPRWKMAVVTWLALLPQVIILSFVIPAGLPFLLDAAVSTAIPVAMLTWVFMPRLTRLLYQWLYAPIASHSDGGLDSAHFRSGKEKT
jgi:antibiotic biosynthesis monooxygenase (ABM) superfamily enzyme